MGPVHCTMRMALGCIDWLAVDIVPVYFFHRTLRVVSVINITWRIAKPGTECNRTSNKPAKAEGRLEGSR